MWIVQNQKRTHIGLEDHDAPKRCNLDEGQTAIVNELPIGVEALVDELYWTRLPNAILAGVTDDAMNLYLVLRMLRQEVRNNKARITIDPITAGHGTVLGL